MTRALTHVDGRWLEGNPPLIGPLTHAGWMASLVFDGARAFDGLVPDLDLHCARCVRSAEALGLAPTVDTAAMVRIALDGIARLPAGMPLYVRPMFYAEDGFVEPDPASTRFILTLLERPMPPADHALSAGVTTRRRPRPEAAPTDAKAACLYPNVGRALREVRARGFDTAVVLDPDGNLAELATSNIFLVRDGVVSTPADNGTFLAGITRMRVIALLREAGLTVEERTLSLDELMAADEVFSTGNAAKVVPVTRIEAREWQPGPVARTARDLYLDYARAHGRPEQFAARFAA